MNKRIAIVGPNNARNRKKRAKKLQKRVSLQPERPSAKDTIWCLNWGRMLLSELADRPLLSPVKVLLPPGPSKKLTVDKLMKLPFIQTGSIRGVKRTRPTAAELREKRAFQSSVLDSVKGEPPG